MRFSINIPDDEYARNTRDVLRILRDYVKNGQGLFMVAHDDCQDGTSVATVGVTAEEDSVIE